MAFTATEQSPKDVYMIDVFDLDRERPRQCVKNDPDLPYCQLLGKYKFKIEDASTIKPYAHMNERCPSVAPDYERPHGC